MNKSDALRIISDAAKIYDKNFLNKNTLIVYGEAPNPKFIEIIAKKSNFLHLTGIVLNDKQLSAEQMYNRLLDGRLSTDDFEFKNDGSTVQKLNVLLQAVNLPHNAKMIGDFNGNRLKLQTDKLAGNISCCVGFLSIGKMYCPSTVLQTDMRKEVNEIHRVLAILNKAYGDKKYNDISYVAKKIEIKPLLKKLSQSVSIDEKIYSDCQREVALSCVSNSAPKKEENLHTNPETEKISESDMLPTSKPMQTSTLKQPKKQSLKEMMAVAHEMHQQQNSGKEVTVNRNKNNNPR